MDIDPAYTAIGKLFEFKPMFFVPKYQRAYAWDKDSINDFIKDLLNCFRARKQNNSLSHFFGGILSIEHNVDGTVNRKQYEIIDGQQRITSFILLVFSMITIYKEILSDAQGCADTENVDIIEKRIDELMQRFIKFEHEVKRVNKTEYVLSLSQRDKKYFIELVDSLSPEAERDSHYRIKDAYDNILTKVKEQINMHHDIIKKIDDLELFLNILDEDFTILHMVTKTKPDAYRLFQVINDRGTSLTDGDLLRAKTLELLEGATTQQDAVEKLWDEILTDHPNDTKNYLNWIYESYKGKRPASNALFDMFMDAFFPQGSTKLEPEAIHATIQEIKNDIMRCKQLEKGQWLYATNQPITGWDVSRLNLLLVELNHTLAIPLLLAAQKLDHCKFSEIVQLLEKAFFRYKIICNQHATPLKNIYDEEALEIRKNPSGYNIRSLKAKLHDLMAKANDDSFKNGLQFLAYNEFGGNKSLKYLLMTIEYYYQWYINGRRGYPKCLDKSRVYDFAGTSIEHIYPQNASDDIKITGNEPLKNSIGNLTIMDPSQNNAGGNKSFTSKKRIYQTSSVELTKRIAKNLHWLKTDIEDHQGFILDIALKIFKL